jgi:pyridoxine 5-phosphate synthase
VVQAARICIAAGAHGITLHPRPDERHANPSDVETVAELLRFEPTIELNVEGNPFHTLLPVVRRVRPTQCTLVPDDVGAPTSDHGWNLARDGERLRPVVAELKEQGIRVSLFIEAGSCDLDIARNIGADRVELYTEAYAAAYDTDEAEAVFETYADTARRAQALGLGVNAGHDLSLENLGKFCTIPGIEEVSIGHALIGDALMLGLDGAVREYLARMPQ